MNLKEEYIKLLDFFGLTHKGYNLKHGFALEAIMEVFFTKFIPIVALAIMPSIYIFLYTFLVLLMS